MASIVNKTITFVVLMVLFTVVSSKFCSLKITDCGSKKGKLISAQINQTCDSSSNAVLDKGSTVQINFTFSADSEEAVLTSKVAGEVKGLPFYVPFPLGNPDACKNSGLTCPIHANTRYSYLPLLYVKSSYPSVSVTVKWELHDKDSENVFCALISARIK